MSTASELRPARAHRLWLPSRDTLSWYVLALVGAEAALLIFDHPLSDLAKGQSVGVVAFFNAVTRWGESDWLLYPSAFLLAVSYGLARVGKKRIPRLALMEMVCIYAIVFVGVGLPSLVSNLIKRAIGRARPEMFVPDGVLSFHPFSNDYRFESFPSGHTTTAFAAAAVLAFLAPRWWWVGGVYALAIALSRLIVGAHYPSDILGGAVLGTVGAFGVRWFFAERRWGFERKPDGAIVARPPVAIRRLIKGSKRVA
jgi:membrane-associated phospholipid phosphatase